MTDKMAGNRDILVVAATQMELRGCHPRRGVRTLVSGIGSASTVLALCDEFRVGGVPDLVLQIGIAGAVDRDLVLGDTCVVGSDYFADLGGWRGDHLALFGANPYSAVDYDLPFKRVNGATVTTACSPLVNYSDVQIETMEGAALYMVCQKYDLRALQLRSISNYMDTPRDQWQVTEALESLWGALDSTLDILL